MKYNIRCVPIPQEYFEPEQEVIVLNVSLNFVSLQTRLNVKEQQEKIILYTYLGLYKIYQGLSFDSYIYSYIRVI